MNRKTLKVLGGLNEAKIQTWNRLCSKLPELGENSDTVSDLKKSLRLIDHIKKQVEEQARGFSKSKLPYIEAGTFLAEHPTLSHSEQHQQVTAILLRPNSSTYRAL